MSKVLLGRVYENLSTSFLNGNFHRAPTKITHLHKTSVLPFNLTSSFCLSHNAISLLASCNLSHSKTKEIIESIYFSTLIEILLINVAQIV